MYFLSQTNTHTGYTYGVYIQYNIEKKRSFVKGEKDKLTTSMKECLVNMLVMR